MTHRICTLAFWGVRGSIPTPGESTVTFGGNTSCVSLEYGDSLLIFDAGSGIRLLGQHVLARDDQDSLHGSIFLTHTHWDHIQGLPFFAPAFREENQFSIYGERRKRYRLTEILEDQMQAPYFPVGMDESFNAAINFHEFELGDVLDVGTDVSVTPFRLAHPNQCVGYVARVGARRIAYVTDHEHPLERLDPTVLTHVRGVDVLIHDAQYSRDELTHGKAGWGHSAWEDVVELARDARVSELYLFHHDPEATDEVLNERQFQAQKRFQGAFIAREGLKIPVGPVDSE